MKSKETPNQTGIQALVREANRRVYDAMDLDAYDRNPSLFEEGRQADLRRSLVFLRRITRGERLLDFGCGTGNVLTLARDIFPVAVGCDIGLGILRQLKARKPFCNLVVGDVFDPPLTNGYFDAITLNGVLHHIAEPAPVLRRLVPLLRPGGAIYTDHDVNYYFGRFYHWARNLKPRPHGGFVSDLTALAEYHNAHTAGLDPVRLAKALKAAGCRRVRINFRQTSNPTLPVSQKLATVFLRMLAASTGARSFFTHFSLLARV